MCLQLDDTTPVCFCLAAITTHSGVVPTNELACFQHADFILLFNEFIYFSNFVTHAKYRNNPHNGQHVSRYVPEMFCLYFSWNVFHILGFLAFTSSCKVFEFTHMKQKKVFLKCFIITEAVNRLCCSK